MRRAQDRVIDTPEFLMTECFTELMINKNETRISRFFYLDGAPQNTEKMYIGGFMGSVDGHGAVGSRELTHAMYSLHLFATKNNTQLGYLIDLWKTKHGELTISKGTEDLGKIARFIFDNHDGLAPLFLHQQKDWEFADGPVVNRNTYDGALSPLYVIGAITSARREKLSYFGGSTYFGDISLRLDKIIGPGTWYLPKEDSKKAESLRTESLRTADVLFSRSMAGSDFRRKVMNEMETMSNFADKSGVKYDSKNWLLLVKDI